MDEIFTIEHVESFEYTHAAIETNRSLDVLYIRVTLLAIEQIKARFSL